MSRFNREDQRRILLSADRSASQGGMYGEVIITQGICESHSRAYRKSMNENGGEAESQKLDISIV